jgi:hypothetical protein
MDRRSRDFEVCLHICFGRRTAIYLGVVVDERKVLTLLRGETHHLLRFDHMIGFLIADPWHLADEPPLAVLAVPDRIALQLPIASTSNINNTSSHNVPTVVGNISNLLGLARCEDED